MTLLIPIRTPVFIEKLKVNFDLNEAGKIEHIKHYGRSLYKEKNNTRILKYPLTKKNLQYEKIFYSTTLLPSQYIVSTKPTTEKRQSETVSKSKLKVFIFIFCDDVLKGRAYWVLQN